MVALQQVLHNFGSGVTLKRCCFPLHALSKLRLALEDEQDYGFDTNTLSWASLYNFNSTSACYPLMVLDSWSWYVPKEPALPALSTDP